MELSAALWSRLPFEGEQRVLSFLSVPDLCRYCIVCKRWNQLISTPKFGALCAQNAAKRDAFFLVIRYRRIVTSPPASPSGSPRLRGFLSSGSKPIRDHDTPAGYWLLDLNTGRWYTVKDDEKKYRHELHAFYVGMDGGLVCQYSMARGGGNSIVVYNPIGKVLKELPTAPDHCTSQQYPELHMVADSTSQSFKIYLINHNFDDTKFLADPSTNQEHRSMLLNDPLVRVYDSTTNEWKSLPIPSCIQKHGVNDVCSIIFQGYLYVLLGSHHGQHPLWRYNLSEGTWENVAGHMPGRIILPQFMVSANRLYLAAWWLEQVTFQFKIGMSRKCRYEVSEIKIADLAQDTLLRMSNAEAMEVFDVKTELVQVDLCPIIASGIGKNSLLFVAKSSRKPMVFDLETRSWGQALPQIPLGRISDEDYLQAGTLMKLILPNTPW